MARIEKINTSKTCKDEFISIKYSIDFCWGSKNIVNSSKQILFLSVVWVLFALTLEQIWSGCRS